MVSPRYRKIQDFTIKCENFGVPQARHRVILLGVREDIHFENPPVLQNEPQFRLKK